MTEVMLCDLGVRTEKELELPSGLCRETHSSEPEAPCTKSDYSEATILERPLGERGKLAEPSFLPSPL